MSKKSKLVEEVSTWKNKRSGEEIDFLALDAAMRALMENSQKVVELKAQLKSTEAAQKTLEKSLAENFSAIKVARKALHTSTKKEETVIAPIAKKEKTKKSQA